ncbi:MAG: ATP-dependent Clp protease ATP-binding subunit [Lachnospiraceae bacterium]|nr:ATP-dependent Clp protease ATP-binding subunit [Lachnospiraceae bacterium]
MKYTKLAEKAFELAKQLAFELGHGYAGSEHVVYALVSMEENYAREVLRSVKVTAEEVSEFLRRMNMEAASSPEGPEQVKAAPQMELLRRRSEEWCSRMNNTEMGTEHILLALLDDPNLMGTKLLAFMGVELGNLYHQIRHELGIPEEREPVMPQGGPADEFADPDKRSMTERFAKDLTSPENLKKADPVIGREEEIQRVMQILCRRTKNNPALVGESGVGKTAIVEALAQRIGKGEVPEILKNKRILALDMAALVAGTKFRGEFEDRLKKLMEEIKSDGNLILFMDEMHTLIGAGNSEGAMDAANILKPALSRGEMQMIGATTVGEYSKHIEKDGALARRFQQVLVEEPDEAQTLTILKGIADRYARHHGVTYTEKALEAAVRLSHRYISDRYMPDKAIDLLDEAGSRARLRLFREQDEARSAEGAVSAGDLQKQKEEAILRGDLAGAAAIREKEKALELQLKAETADNKRAGRMKEKAITAADVEDVVSLWTGIPLSKLAESDADRLAHMEDRIHERVIGQNEAVAAVSKAIRRGRLGLKDPKRPIGSFLLLGPTGVGKTELSKAVAEVMFAQEDALIRVDMSEYMEKYSVSKFIGSAPGYVGYEEGGQLSEKIRKKPYSVILFDEIEKAHPDVFNILLQVLDEGHITDSKGRKVDFKNTVIIMTSNTGARSIQSNKHLGFRAGDTAAADYRQMKDHVMEEVKRTFRPEFLNRIDDMIVFHSLTKEEIADIAELMFRAVSKQLQESQQIRMVLSPEAKEYFCRKGYDPAYGARPLRRLLQSDLEDLMADAILAGTIHAGASVLVTVEEDKIALKEVKE